ncbi:unnamed protein product [Zymoseptoria tritici ST99CH_3D1]|uniref:Uncharacterized protein n=2 Tax=Zymoseptoria tritici TaxID=1047171 RepID=A0A1X7RQK9_ZYMT9|nr:unnamed protein product [Zymoseptoria tritici ST99CH_3D7]SMR50272.1 unnamed protein product [Zymoseptoria tritici ST99CH_3D1]
MRFTILAAIAIWTSQAAAGNCGYDPCGVQGEACKFVCRDPVTHAVVFSSPRGTCQFDAKRGFHCRGG